MVSKQPLSFRKFKYLNKVVVVMKRKMKQCVFLAGLRLKLSRFYMRRILLLALCAYMQVHQNMFSCRFRVV